MYTNDYERRGFSIRDFLLKLILVIIFVFLLAWLLPKFMGPSVYNYNNKDGKCQTGTCDTTGISALTSQIFADNIEKMKNAAISYYTDERLPKNVGDSDTMTLSDMIGKKIILALIDKNNKVVDLEKSYVKITKLDDEYILKVNLKDSEKEDYILVHLGCYTYCEGLLCQKQTTNVAVKGSKVTGYVPIKGSINNGVYYPPKQVVPVIKTKIICGYKNGKYYDKNGKIVSKSEYERQCIKKPEKKYYCDTHNGKYYGKDGKVVSYEEYVKQCTKPVEKHYCVKYNGKYYGKDGKVVSYETYKKQCQQPEEKHYCVYYKGKYYDEQGNVVSKNTYKKRCTQPEDKHYCGKYKGKYYGKDGDVVSYDEYKKQCFPEVEYIYEYKKTTDAELSAWTKWSSWSKTNCGTDEINCSDSNPACLLKLQVYKQKEKIGTYDKTYARQRQELRQTGSYTQKACSKYNYVEINKTIYATTTTTTYTQTNTITSTTRHSTGGWIYNGRASYKNPPRDSAAVHYKFVGADYSYCSDTCTTLPNYYYDSYTYGGGLSSVSSTTTPGAVSSSTSTSTSSSTTTTSKASCGEYVYKTIPIYGYVTVTDKATRKEPLYGTTCYKSTKTREMVKDAETKYTWSVKNDMTLINSGWTMTGNKKQK